MRPAHYSSFFFLAVLLWVGAAPRQATSQTKRRTNTTTTRAAQQRPTPQRYLEIEKALAERGYLGETPSGKWGPRSVEALKRFQADQNLKADGQLSALSLIALGLGPRRNGVSPVAGPVPAPAVFNPLSVPLVPDPEPWPPPPEVDTVTVFVPPAFVPGMGPEIPAPPDER